MFCVSALLFQLANLVFQYVVTCCPARWNWLTGCNKNTRFYMYIYIVCVCVPALLLAHMNNSELHMMQQGHATQPVEIYLYDVFLKRLPFSKTCSNMW